MTSAFYLIGGIGATDFAGDKKFTVNFGAGYRVRADATGWRFTSRFEDHVFQSRPAGHHKLTNNLEARLGTTVVLLARGIRHEEPYRGAGRRPDARAAGAGPEPTDAPAPAFTLRPRDGKT